MYLNIDTCKARGPVILLLPLFSWIFLVLANCYNSLRVEMSLHLDTQFLFRANQALFFLLIAVCLAEKQQVPIS